MNSVPHKDIQATSSVWTTAAVIRILILWVMLGLWALWTCSLFGSIEPREALISLKISLFVGTILNVLNWVPYPCSERAMCRVAWFARLLGNYAIPFAVSLTSGLFAR